MAAIIDPCLKVLEVNQICCYIVFQLEDWYVLISDSKWSNNMIVCQKEQGNQRWQIPRPATCQCLATFTPLKSKNLIFCRDVISLLARVFIFLIDRARALSKRFPWQIFERNCRSSCWDIRHWIIRQARCLLKRHDATYVRYIFYPEYIDISGVCMQKFVMIHWILQYSNIVNITILWHGAHVWRQKIYLSVKRRTRHKWR